MWDQGGFSQPPEHFSRYDWGGGVGYFVKGVEPPKPPTNTALAVRP